MLTLAGVDGDRRLTTDAHVVAELADVVDVEIDERDVADLLLAQLDRVVADHDVDLGVWRRPCRRARDTRDSGTGDDRAGGEHESKLVRPGHPQAHLSVLMYATMLRASASETSPG